ncbi:hypothetical protein DVH24_007060 [Malus domestica]|uniref:Uncharacterized protein n=1 Tax=Malus domestica TaxID=3750 RepID=A0A498HHL5_MALDO|nr:hypothetical protein DVH24_007060 [Malus domestica]
MLQETQNFRAEHSRRLLKEKETFGPDLRGVIGVCAEALRPSVQVGPLTRASLEPHCSHGLEQIARAIGSFLSPVHQATAHAGVALMSMEDLGHCWQSLHLVGLKEKELPGAPLAARTSPLWAQINHDRDWEIRNSKSQK